MKNAFFQFPFKKEREKPWQEDQQNRPLNWFLFFWLVFIYVQDILAPFEDGLQSNLRDPTAGKANANLTDLLSNYFSRMNERSIVGPTFGLLFPLLAFTLLMVFQGGLLWLVLFRKSNRRSLWLYVLLQVVCIWLVFFVADTDSAASSLCFLLAIEAIILLKRLSWITVGVVGCLLYYSALQGFGLLLLLQSGGPIQSVELKLIITVADILALTPFACAGFLLYMQQTRARQRDQELLCELENAHIQLEDYAARVKDLTLTTERQRIARELHDTLAQGLVGLTMQLETIDSLLLRQDCEQARTIVQRAMTRSRTTITSARAAITSLRAELPTTGDMLNAIEAEAEHFTLATGIPCTCSLHTQLPDEYHEHLLRLVSEGLTNIARHARASQAWVRAESEHAAITLEIGDNGVGFEPAQVTTGHYGLLGLRERARLMNAQLLIRSEPSKGTIIRLWLPWERKGKDEQRAG
jgi:NarL family two-component system sensor histidine kinase YdfH